MRNFTLRLEAIRCYLVVCNKVNALLFSEVKSILRKVCTAILISKGIEFNSHSNVVKLYQLAYTDSGCIDGTSLEYDTFLCLHNRYKNSEVSYDAFMALLDSLILLCDSYKYCLH